MSVSQVWKNCRRSPMQYSVAALRRSTLAALRPVVDFARQELESKTIRKAMSTASYEFARHFLFGLRIFVKDDMVCTDAGSKADPPPYDWTVLSMDDRTPKIGEHRRTPHAVEWFKQNFLLADS